MILFGGIKTEWLAVRERSPEAVADALDVIDREIVPRDEYRARWSDRHLYIAEVETGWAFVNGRCSFMPCRYGATDPQFPDWFAALSARLGEVQFFANQRNWSYHAWVHAIGGKIIRAYGVYDGWKPLFIGEPTHVERVLGRGLYTLPESLEDMSPDDWDTYYAARPGESDVLAVAEAWGTSPEDVDERTVTKLIRGIQAEPT